MGDFLNDALPTRIQNILFEEQSDVEEAAQNEELGGAGVDNNLDTARKAGWLRSIIRALLKGLAWGLDHAKVFCDWLCRTENVGWAQYLTSKLALAGNIASTAAKIFRNCIHGLGVLLAAFDSGLKLVCVAKLVRQKRRIESAMRKITDLVKCNQYIAGILRSLESSTPNNEAIRAWAFALMHRNTLKMESISGDCYAAAVSTLAGIAPEHPLQTVFNAGLDVLSTVCSLPCQPLAFFYGLFGLVRLIASLLLFKEHGALKAKTKAVGDVQMKFKFIKNECNATAAALNMDNGVEDALRAVERAEDNLLQEISNVSQVRESIWQVVKRFFREMIAPFITFAKCGWGHLSSWLAACIVRLQALLHRFADRDDPEEENPFLQPEDGGQDEDSDVPMDPELQKQKAAGSSLADDGIFDLDIL